ETRPAGVLAAELIASGRADHQTLSSLRDAVRRADWAEAETIGRSFGQQWQRKRWVQVTSGSLLRRLTRRLAPSRSPASARGLTVALLGPDGAGKSTLTSRLTKAWPIPTETIYMGVFRSSNRERYWRIIPGLALAVKLLRLRTRATRGSLHRRRGGLVLFDRYTYDAILRPGRRTL